MEAGRTDVHSVVNVLMKQMIVEADTNNITIPRPDKIVYILQF